MEFVVDANVIISSLISSSGKTSEILFSNKLKLYAPEFLMEEIDKHKKEISKKSELSLDELNVLISLISLNVDLIPFSEFEEFLTTAENVCPDPNDTEYFALAFKLKCPLWSDDKKLKSQQNMLKVLNTLEVSRLI